MYVDYNDTTKREWKRIMEIHKRNLSTISKAHSRKLHANLNSPERDIRKRHSENHIIPEGNPPNRIPDSGTPRITLPALAQKVKIRFSKKFINKEKKRKIIEDDKKMCFRINSVISSMDLKKLAKNYEYIEKIKKNISKPYVFTSKSPNNSNL